MDPLYWFLAFVGMVIGGCAWAYFAEKNAAPDPYFNPENYGRH